MGILSPWFLLGLAAIGLPVYVHLLRRHILPPQRFSSLMFFERGTQSSTRHRRLRYLLLFSLRVALLLLLVLAFANPFIRFAGGGVENKLLLVVLDNSFSMRAGSRFAEAKQSALQVLASRPQAQRAQVMALGSRLAVLTQPTEDAGSLRSAVESLQPGDARANLGDLASGLRALAVTVHTPVELHFFSDMQKTAMPANFADMALPTNVTVVVHQADTSSANWTIESVNAPAQVADPGKARVEAVIAGYATKAATKTVSLVVNGKAIAKHQVEVAADGRATVEFHPLDVPYGVNRCAVTIDSGDSFAADDTSLFAVKRSDPRRILFVHQTGDTRSPLYFGAALAAGNQQSFILQSVESDKAAEIDPAKYAFVVLSDTIALPSAFENALTRHVSKGGNLLIAAGTAAGHRAHIPVFGGAAAGARSYPQDTYETVGQTDLTHPVFRSVAKDAKREAATNADAGWADLKIHYVAGVDAAQARVIARLADQTPLLLEKQIGEGHVLVFASGFDNLTNDLPVSPAFVPFVDRAARYLAGDNISGSSLVDSFVPLRTAAALAANPSAGIEILDPDGHRALSLKEAATAQTFQLARAGFYHIRFADGTDSLIGVNPDRRESNLEPMPEDLLQLWTARPASPASPGVVDVQPKKSPHSIWWYVMLLVLLTAVAESVLASRYLGTQREQA